MTIFATVRFGQHEVTQGWQFLNVEPSPLLILMPLKDGTQLALELERKRVKDQTGLELAEKTYFGSLDVSDAIILKPIEPN